MTKWEYVLTKDNKCRSQFSFPKPRQQRNEVGILNLEGCRAKTQTSDKGAADSWCWFVGTKNETESMEKTGGNCHWERGEPWDDADRNREQNRKQQELFSSLSVLSFGKI